MLGVASVVARQGRGPQKDRVCAEHLQWIESVRPPTWPGTFMGLLADERVHCSEEVRRTDRGKEKQSEEGPKARSIPAWGIAPDYYIEKSIIFAKIFTLRVCSVCQYLLLWERSALTKVRPLEYIILDNLR